MSKELGPVAWGQGSDEVFLGRQMGSQGKMYSEETARRIDAEVTGILSNAYAAAVTILKDNLHILHKITERLLEVESLEAEEFSNLVDESEPVPPGEFAWMGS
jgi:cell division protease FtsH